MGCANMSKCLRCGEEKKVKVSVTSTKDKADWHYECRSCGLHWDVNELRVSGSA